MRPVIPALAALASGEPRRRAYWEAELLNALTIVERGWAQPVRDDRLVGRRHGPHPVDARSLAAHGRRLRPRWPHHRRSASPMTRSPAPRAIWSSAAATAAAKPGAARSICRRHALADNRTWRSLCEMAGARRRTRRRHGLRTAAATRCKLWLPVARRPGISDRAELPRGLLLQPVHQLHAGAAASRRPASVATARSASNSPAASARRPSRRCKEIQRRLSEHGLQDRRHRRPHRQRHR